MKNLFLTLILAFATVCAGAQVIDSNNKIHCRIEGEVKEPSFIRILLLPEDADPRVTPVDTILVKDGRFAHDLYVDEPAMYEMWACEDYNNGAWFPLEFFAEEGVVHATFYGYALENAIRPELRSETPLNKELLDYNARLDLFRNPLKQEKDSLEKAGKMFTAQGYVLKKLFDECEDRDSLRKLSERIENLDKEGALYSPEYYAFNEKSKRVREDVDVYVQEYIRDNHTLVGLYLLANKIRMSRETDYKTKRPYIELFERIYEPKFPGNRMTTGLRNLINSFGVVTGTRFIDFTLPDLSGAEHTLSKEIEGKIAVIDFWASWCGPCRRASMSLIPLYEKYKDKGFIVVGVASELNSEDMRLAIEKDGYPWLNLLALHDRQNIWERYGLQGAGGTFLVDRDGTIIAIDATADEIEQILKKRL